MDFASDNKNGTNLKPTDVMFRDLGEVVNSNTEDYMNPTQSTTVEIMQHLSHEQEELLMFGLRDAYEFMLSKNKVGAEKLIDNLAQDESLLSTLEEMLGRVRGMYQHPIQMSYGGHY